MKNESIFPNIETEGDGHYSQQSPFDGLTKRELFAAMALQGIVVSTSYTDHEALADRAVKIADALIEALKESEVL